MPAPVAVDFYFSPTSAYAYLASTQMLQLQIEAGCRVEWYPVSGPMMMAAAGYDFAKAKPHSGAYQAEYRATDLQRWARLLKIPYRPHADVVIPDGPRLALACVAARRYDAGQVFARALMKAIFVDGRSPADEAMCRELAESTGGISAELFTTALNEPETASLHQTFIDTAKAAGVFGVPSWVIGGKEIVFGLDHLPLLRQAIQDARGS